MVWSGQSRSSTTNGGENILCVVASRGDGVVMLSISLGSVAFLSRHVSPHGRHRRDSYQTLTSTACTGSRSPPRRASNPGPRPGTCG